MDFWSKLLSSNPLSSSAATKDTAKDPVRRLNRFEKEYSQFLHLWRKSSNLASDDDAAEAIEERIQELTDILSDESRRPLPHPCISFAAAKQIYIPIAKVATTSYNEFIIKEAVYFYATLIESEEEAFVERESFASSLTNLMVKITGPNSIRLGSDTEVRVVELAFNITTKIRLDPGILPAWFKSHQVPAQTGPGSQGQRLDEHEKFKGRTQRQDFPLFYILMDYIHHEGKMGDFARTGLLYIIESASTSVSLETWIVESDLSTLMATGLGALYSQLSRKLVIDHPPHDLPPSLALSDYQHPRSTYEIVSSCSPEYRTQMETFLSHLHFWQDVLNHCRSAEVKHTLLEHFQVIFLQQLLYPSLLESSDIDGGSSVAVLTYLRRILESLDHPDMINLILHYLLALPNAANVAPSESANKVSKARRRKSMDLATMMASQADDAVDPLLFNLVDLILACLRSHSHQTIHVTLQLISTILKRHHRYAVVTLLRTVSIHGDKSRRSIGAHQQEVDFFVSLAGAIGGQDIFDEIYDNVLKDTTLRVEGHPCSHKLVAPKTSAKNHELPTIPDSLPGAPRDVGSHTLRPDDPLLNAILDRLETFFVNPVDLNLSVTETIFDLAVCGHMSLEGWMSRSPDKYSFDDENNDDPLILTTSSEPDSTVLPELQTIASLRKHRRRPHWESSSLPRLFRVLQSLTDQVAVYRDTVPRFDDLLQQRREAFQTADSASIHSNNFQPSQQRNQTATPGNRDLASPVDDRRNDSPARPSALEGFAQRIFSELGTPSRSASPRGRKEVGTPGLSGGYGIATPSRPVPVPPWEPKGGYETPSKTGGVARSFSPGGGSVSVSDADHGAVGSQVAAFQAVDQSILARRVGIPEREQEVEAIPLRLKQDDAPNKSRKQNEGEDEVEAQVDGADESKALADAESEDAADSSALVSEIGDTEPSNKETEGGTATVSHVLTNTIILQFFLFELASLLQVRAGIFDEVRFVEDFPY